MERTEGSKQMVQYVAEEQAEQLLMHAKHTPPEA